MGDLLPLPTRMAKCTPDTHIAIFNIAKALAKKGGRLILSDLFRSYDMQANHTMILFPVKRKRLVHHPEVVFMKPDVALTWI
jgi:hypothetical protein